MPIRKLWKFAYTFCSVTLALGPLLLLILSVTLLTWALVNFAQGKAANSMCAHRVNAQGFEGNPDFYGLGIRLGIYLQWASSLIASATSLGKERSMAGTYVLFNIALYVALLLLVFKGDCVFSAEVIVVLYFAWGGVYVVLEPFHWTALTDLTQEESNDEGFIETLLFRHMALVTLTLLLPTTAWFWIRLATVGEFDFLPNPAGTVYFLFTSVQPPHLKLGSKFMASFCILGYLVRVVQTNLAAFFINFYVQFVRW